MNTINITGLSVNAQHIPSPDQGLYRNRWLRMVILLLYGLSLVVAVDLLFTFPYERSVVTTVSDDTYRSASGINPEELTEFVVFYVVWLSLNTTVLGAFTFLVISIPDEDSRLCIHSIGYYVLLLFTSAIGRRPTGSTTPGPEKAGIITLAFYVTVAGIIAASITYDWWWMWN